MQFRDSGRLGKRVSALGFGAMRLPHEEGDTSKINQKESIEMIRYAIDEGVNYIDTAWPYHQGESEPFLKEALAQGYREKVLLATKMPSWLIEKEEDMDKYLQNQLQRLNTEEIDIYLLHSLNREKWEKLEGLHVISWLEKKKREGYIKDFGFSFHDSFPVFKEIVDSYPWSICQIQYNYVDREFQAGEAGLKYAAEREIAVVIMEPLRGGSLASLPPNLLSILNRGEKKRSPADWALQWLWHQREVALVLSGMSTLEQVKENIESAKNSDPLSLSQEELKRIEEVSRAYRDLAPTGCTGCNYCQPCPEGVMIPHMFSFYNESHIYDSYEKTKKEYESFPERVRSDKCTACGSCVEECPQDLPIPELMEKIAAYFA